MNNNFKKNIMNKMQKMGKVPKSMKLNNNRASQSKTSGTKSFVSHGSLNNNLEAQNLKQNHKKDKPLKIFGGVCLTLFVAATIFSITPSLNVTDAAQKALATKVSTSLPAGTKLQAQDGNTGEQDYTITHKYDKSETKIWVWDYAAEDGDYVQVLVNGTPVTDSFMIKNKPVELTVPAVGKVQIKGIRDGGGGITYAVRYDLNGTSYFNSAPVGKFNTYTLTKEN